MDKDIKLINRSLHVISELYRVKKDEKYAFSLKKIKNYMNVYKNDKSKVSRIKNYIDTQLDELIESCGHEAENPSIKDLMHKNTNFDEIYFKVNLNNIQMYKEETDKLEKNSNLILDSLIDIRDKLLNSVSGKKVIHIKPEIIPSMLTDPNENYKIIKKLTAINNSIFNLVNPEGELTGILNKKINEFLQLHNDNKESLEFLCRCQKMQDSSNHIITYMMPDDIVEEIKKESKNETLKQIKLFVDKYINLYKITIDLDKKITFLVNEKKLKDESLLEIINKSIEKIKKEDSTFEIFLKALHDRDTINKHTENNYTVNKITHFINAIEKKYIELINNIKKLNPSSTDHVKTLLEIKNKYDALLNRPSNDSEKKLKQEIDTLKRQLTALSNNKSSDDIDLINRYKLLIQIKDSDYLALKESIVEEKEKYKDEIENLKKENNTIKREYNTKLIEFNKKVDILESKLENAVRETNDLTETNKSKDLLMDAIKKGMLTLNIGIEDRDNEISELKKDIVKLLENVINENYRIINNLVMVHNSLTDIRDGTLDINNINISAVESHIGIIGKLNDTIHDKLKELES